MEKRLTSDKWLEIEGRKGCGCEGAVLGSPVVMTA